MSCCGNRRAGLTPAPTPARTSAAPPAPARQVAPPAPGRQALTGHIEVRYVDQVPVTVQGRATGARYAFSAAQPLQRVDARDAEALLMTRYFRRER